MIRRSAQKDGAWLSSVVMLNAAGIYSTLMARPMN